MTIAEIVNNEQGFSVRAKLNAVINAVNMSALGLGAPNNIFGDAPADASTPPLTINAAATKTAAEAVRDAYFTANPSNLTAYDTTPALHILLMYVVNTDIILLPQSRVGGSWETSVALVAVQGIPGAQAALGSVNFNHVPVRGPSGFEDSGIELLSSGAIKIPGATLGIGDVLEISEATGFAMIHNNVDNRNYIILDHALSKESGSSRPRQYFVDGDSITEFPVQSVATTQIASNPISFDYTTTLSGATFELNINAFAPMTNLKVRFIDIQTGIPFKYIPSELAWDDDSRAGVEVANAGIFTFDFFSSLDNINASRYNVGNSPFVLQPQRQLRIEMKGDNIAVLGDTNGAPMLTALVGQGRFRDIAYTDDIMDGGGGITPPPADTDDFYFGLINEDNANTVSLDSLTYITEVTSPHTINTGIVSTDKYFVVLVPAANDITTIHDTVLNQDVTSIFTRVANARTIATVLYNSYTIGPLSVGLNENYLLRF